MEVLNSVSCGWLDRSGMDRNRGEEGQVVSHESRRERMGIIYRSKTMLSHIFTSLYD